MKDKDWIENYCSGRVENYFERTHIQTAMDKKTKKSRFRLEMRM